MPEATKTIRSRLRGWLSSRRARALVAIIVVLVAIRAALPVAVEWYVERTLDQLEGFTGRVADIDLNLWRGAYVIEGLEVEKDDGKVVTPFVSIARTDLSVEWSALLDGALVSEIELDRPVLNFVAPPSEDSARGQTDPSDNWYDVVKDLVPFQINRFAIRGGEVHYRDFNSEPKVDLYLQKIRATARNLTNSESLSNTLAASFDARALVMGSGQLRLEGRLDPSQRTPTFDLNVSVKQLDMRQINNYLKAYVGVDAEAGTFGADAEFAAQRGRFKGYVKPFIADLQILDWGGEEESFPNQVWQGIVDVAAELFENHARDRIATRIPFEGTVDTPEAGVWATAFGVVRNAFIQALQRGIEGTVDLSDS